MLRKLVRLRADTMGNRELLWQIDMTSTYDISFYFVQIAQTFFLLLIALLKIIVMTREMEMYALHSV
jgi:hypothetical protein